MKSIKKIFVITALTLAAVCNCSFAAGSNQKGSTFKPASGGYTLNIPAQSKEIFRTTTGIRFISGKDLLVSADIYSMPNFISVPMKNYSQQQAQDLEKFILNMQDYPNLVFVKDKILPQNQPTVKKQAGSSALQQWRNKHSNTPLETVDKALKDKADNDSIKSPVLKINETECDFTLKPSKTMDMTHDFIIGKAYQLRNDKLLILRVSSPKSEGQIATGLLRALTSSIKLSKLKYPEDNKINATISGYKLDMPFGWHAFTLKAYNIIMMKSLSSVHNDEGMMRSFKTTAYANFANANASNIHAAEDAFVKQITKYTPNVTVTRHEAFVADGTNGCIIQTTDSDDLKKVFVVNGYLFSKDGYGYQFRFSTDDTINYDIKVHSFIKAIKSFQRIK
ncbi:MAG: hypothetical protein LKE29_07410 [Acidaminococcaceae bacterium]|nr:hypothetical protein [Acidaminococcaceae bacterium]